MRWLLPTLILLATSCGGGSSPAPTPSPTPPATPTYTLSGRVTNEAAVPIGGATVEVMDGPNAGRSAQTNNSGNYSLAGLSQSGFTARATADYHRSASMGVTLTADRTVNFQLREIPLFRRSGTGNTVFDMPTHVRRVRIVGTYTRSSQNFVVWIDGDLIVNELLGTHWGMTRYEGIHLTGGGVTEVKLSSGVSWSFSEVR